MEAVKGFRDIEGQEAIKLEKVQDLLVKTFKLYGFEPAFTPIVEYESFVKGENFNDEAVSDIFRLQDKGKRDLALRYEFTFQLKRLSKNKKLPYKRYQIGPVFRDEPVSSNRFRQFIQCDADIVGSSIKEEVEILDLANKILNLLGIKAKIYFNNRKLLNEILEGINNKEAVIKEIDKLDKLSEKKVKENLKKYNAEKILNLFKKEKSFFKKYNSFKELEELEDYAKIYGLKLEFLPSLARGLSYYNGTIFEIKSSDIKETIIAGGSYLINGIQSTGISFGLDRLANLAKIETDKKEILIINISKDKESVKLANELRNEGVSCSIQNRISKALDYANVNRILYVVFVGEEEVKQKKFKFRDMKTGKEKLVSLEDIKSYFK